MPAARITPSRQSIPLSPACAAGPRGSSTPHPRQDPARICGIFLWLRGSADDTCFSFGPKYTIWLEPRRLDPTEIKLYLVWRGGSGFFLSFHPELPPSPKAVSFGKGSPQPATPRGKSLLRQAGCRATAQGRSPSRDSTRHRGPQAMQAPHAWRRVLGATSVPTPCGDTVTAEAGAGHQAPPNPTLAARRGVPVVGAAQPPLSLPAHRCSPLPTASRAPQLLPRRDPRLQQGLRQEERREGRSPAASARVRSRFSSGALSHVSCGEGIFPFRNPYLAGAL